MQIFYIRKKTFVRFALIFTVILVSLIYTRQLRKGTLSVLFNNDGILPICSVEIPDKKIALTFDIGWDSNYTKDILDVLKKYDVRGTFFITGTWAQKNPDMVKVIDQDKNEIGNHSLTHPRMLGLTKKAIVSEIKETDLKIMKITGKRTKVFRTPFGEYNDALVSTVKEMGYKMVQWDIDSLDWKGADEHDIYERVASKAGNGSIILFHNDMPATSVALCNIIEKLEKDGYKFTTVSDMLLKENFYIDNTGRQRPLE